MSAPARPRRERRTVDGILLLDKPEGLSSNQVLQRVRRLYGAEKAGHTGSLDPLASGVLPLCFGQATKVAGLLLDADKTYATRVALGRRTATGDREGEVVETAPVPALDRTTIETALAQFRGRTEQVPPMYSALKKGGQALYALARQGVTVERAPRPILITRLALTAFGADWLELEITCSKGTYIRTLGEDIARALGTVGHLATLRRTGFGGALNRYPSHALVTLEARAGDPEALNALLLPVDAALEDLPAMTLDAARAARFRHGQEVAGAAPAGLHVRVYATPNVFLGLGEAARDGSSVRPLRLMSPAAEVAAATSGCSDGNRD